MTTIYKIAESIIDIASSGNERERKGKLNNLLQGSGLHSLTSSLRDYRKRSQGEIKKKYSTLFQQLMLLVQIYLDISEQIGRSWNNTSKKFQESTQYRINAVSKLYNKSTQTTLDMLTLLENGSLVSTLPLWRMIYENYLVSKFLISQEDDISLQFNDHELFDITRFITKPSKSDKKKIDIFIQKYGDHFKTPYGWAYKSDSKKQYKSFQDIQKVVKEKDFASHYKLTSAMIHSSSFSVNRSIFSDGEHGNVNMLGIFNTNLDFPYQITVQIMLKYSELLINQFVEGMLDEKSVLLDTVDLVTRFVLEGMKEA